MKVDFTQLAGKKVLITGGLGFIGSNLAHRLVHEGAAVTILDACLDPYGWNPANIKEIKDQVQFVKGDIRDYTLLEKLVQEKDYIFHLAAQVGREISMADPWLDVDINCNGTIALCRAVAAVHPAARVVYAGSRGQIGEPIYLPVDENHPDHPTDVYGINKLAAEKYLFLYSKIYGFTAVSLRLNNVYGPRCQMQHGYYGILNWFIRNAMQNTPITVYGDGQQTRDYVYVEDVVDAFVRAALVPETNQQIYMIGSGIETVFLDMVKAVIAGVGQGRYVHIPFPPERESIDIRKFVVSCDKMTATTGWRPMVELAEGVARCVAFYRERYDEYIKKGE
ncbi:MAG TPA: SDR family NAD(P)-dependent oxidoreductase [bacterium]|nr:SDR family NAD(P)-dependent oxidoreductase [bacterium]HQG46964.1 SDR family NAD(P)-dependent oxidoreductase [bacterium]HQI48781.1 SDR family NAD(P)-dependent oxidoreductase [bacterium]HQJ64262.1 SDR family NAD(P)-dependent oxidoreductase [bacterium]